jgi:predicted transcriptional regulator
VKNRSRIEIAATILETVREGAAKTRVMYSAFISYSQSKEYLKLLMDKGMIEYNNDEKKYYITPAGREFLKIYDKIKETLDPSNMF